MPEHHPQVLAVEVAVKIQQMHFQPHLLAAQSGTGSQVRHPRLILTQAPHFHGEHPGHRGAHSLGQQVGGGDANGPPQFLTVDDPAGHKERTTQHDRSRIEIAVLQTFSDPGTADPFPVPLKGVRVFHGKAVFLTHLLEETEITGPIIAEAEVISHHQMLDSHAFDQDVLAELPGGLAAEAPVKLYTEDTIQTQLGQYFHLFPKGHQAGRGLIRSKELAGLRLEHHHSGGNPQCLGFGGYLTDDGPVPQVDTIKVTNGCHTAPVAVPQVVYAANQLHSSAIMPKRRAL